MREGPIVVKFVAGRMKRAPQYILLATAFAVLCVGLGASAEEHKGDHWLAEELFTKDASCEKKVDSLAVVLTYLNSTGATKAVAEKIFQAIKNESTPWPANVSRLDYGKCANFSAELSALAPFTNTCAIAVGEIMNCRRHAAALSKSDGKMNTSNALCSCQTMVLAVPEYQACSNVSASFPDLRNVGMSYRSVHQVMQLDNGTCQDGNSSLSPYEFLGLSNQMLFGDAGSHLPSLFLLTASILVLLLKSI